MNMPRPFDRSVLEAGLLEQPMLWKQDGFAIADGYDDATSRYRGLVLPSDDGASIAITGETLIVRPDLAVAQREAETGAVEGEAASGAGEGRPEEPSGTS